MFKRLSPRRLIALAISLAFVGWLMRLSILHWKEVESGDSFVTLASLSVIAELIVFGMGAVLARATRSGVIAGVAAIMAALVFEAGALYQPSRGLMEKLVPLPVETAAGELGAQQRTLLAARKELTDALASGNADRLQAAIGAVDVSLLTDDVVDGQIGPATRRAAAQAQARVSRDLGAAQEGRRARFLWEALPMGLVVLFLAVSLSLGHVALGPERSERAPKGAALEPQRIRYTAQDFALGRVPPREGYRRVASAPTERYPSGRVSYRPGVEEEASYLASVARMRREIGLDKPQTTASNVVPLTRRRA